MVQTFVKKTFAEFPLQIAATSTICPSPLLLTKFKLSTKVYSDFILDPSQSLLSHLEIDHKILTLPVQ